MDGIVKITNRRLPDQRIHTLGNNVVVGTGGIVLVAIYTGDGARIGAGSVVVHDVPSGAVVVGVPGRGEEFELTLKRRYSLAE